MIHVPKGDVPDDFCCAASGRPLFYPVVTDQGVAYCYSVLFEMFMKATTSPKCAALASKEATRAFERPFEEVFAWKRRFEGLEELLSSLERAGEDD